MNLLKPGAEMPASPSSSVPSSPEPPGPPATPPLASRLSPPLQPPSRPLVIPRMGGENSAFSNPAPRQQQQTPVSEFTG
ncbi:hypothetical protein V5799_027771 [Amblyomma americanum]|uniref:Uncharacterized protein n=1 Tax=Amblyomma americanum TaxID=6943 RepID=A0AAQ4DES1_AMBAM